MMDNKSFPPFQAMNQQNMNHYALPFRKNVQNYHFLHKNKKISRALRAKYQGQEANIGRLQKQKPSLNQQIRNDQGEALYNPQIQENPYKKLLNKNLEQCGCGKDLCTCDTENESKQKLPPLTPATDNSQRKNEKTSAKDINNNLISNPNNFISLSSEQIKRQADRILRHSPFNAVTTYKKTFGSHSVSYYLAKQINLPNKLEQQYKTRKKVIYNPKFNRLEGVTTYQRYHNLDSLPNRLKVSPEKPEQYNNFVVPGNFCHKYGKQYSSCMILKRQLLQSQINSLGKYKNLFGGQTQYKKQYSRPKQEPNFQKRRVVTQGSAELPYIKSHNTSILKY